MKNWKTFIMVGVCILLTSCFGCKNIVGIGQSPTNKIYCVSYNAQTFFDAIDDGNEFPEFLGVKSKWSAEKYKNRLKRLQEVGMFATQSLGGKKNTMPDIFVVQEIESIRVIEDFCKHLPKNQSYEFASFIEPTGSENFSTVVFSKFPIVSVEKFYIKNNTFGQSKLRPLIKTIVEIENGKNIIRLSVFGVHWKSKWNGEEKTAPLRLAQEKQLYAKIKQLKMQNPDEYFIICGDFNQRTDEFSVMSNLNNCWNLKAYKEEEKCGLQPKGSYLYKDSWEQIDHIFYSDNLADDKALELSLFAVIHNNVITKSGKPYKYSAYSGRGYSDHLPIGCVLEFTEGARN